MKTVTYGLGKSPRSHVAEAILDVVAEDPEVEHVAQEVKPARVQEGARDGRNPREVGWNHSIGVEDVAQGGVRNGELVEENERAGSDKADGDDRRRARGDDVADRKHEGESIANPNLAP